MSYEIGQNETFIRLIQIARDDSLIREQLSAILSLDSFNRQSALNSMLENMRLKNAPPDFMAAVACLLDNQAAQEALKIISGKPPLF